MGDLFRMNWEAFDPVTGIKVVVASLLVFGLMAVTGESWIATGLVVLFAWLTNVPGPLKDRVAGMVAFAIGAIALTYLSGWIGLDLWSNTIAIVIISILTIDLALAIVGSGVVVAIVIVVVVIIIAIVIAIVIIVSAVLLGIVCVLVHSSSASGA